MDLSLKGKHALVCGSTQGIGLASAVALAELGATITLAARDEKRLKELATRLPNPGNVEHGTIAADFAEPDHLAQAAAERVSQVPVQILINNTGGPPGGKAYEATAQEYERAFAMHVLSAQALLNATLPGMCEAKYGRVINIISTSVKQPIPGLGVSNTIRGAMASWAKTLAHELGPFNITVNNVLPGFTETGRLDSIIANKAAAAGSSEETIANAMRSSVPLQRFARADEVANAVAFLASPAASYINGINVPVDGGRTSTL